MLPSNQLLDRTGGLGQQTAGAGSSGAVTHSRQRRFFDMMSVRSLTPMFQPILDLHVGDFFAYEGLIQAPQSTSAHAPSELSSLAHEAGVTLEYERICREGILKRYAALGLTQRLFINCSIPCLSDPDYRRDGDTAFLASLGLSPGRVVIEITENRQIRDFSELHLTLDDYRRRGIDFAMDDLGEGFSNLRMWSELRPDFVKIDHHFISGIATDPLKFQLVKAMQQIAETCGAQLIAKGIETESEFTIVRDLGIRFAQGILLAPPAATPPLVPENHIRNLISAERIIVFPRSSTHSGGYEPVGQLAHALEPISPDTDNDLVYALFERQPDLLALPVVNEGKPVGLINRFNLIDRFARPFRRELFGKKSCRLMMDDHPVVVDCMATVQDAARTIGSHDSKSFSDSFIITKNEGYLGVGRTRELMALITDMQIRSARYANPLTQLPGNVPINEHIERLLVSKTDFVACYADLDSFKPYNDVYGYRRGDEVILMLSQILAEVVSVQDDFLGHIGGDDFMILFQSHDWEERCQQALALFDARVEKMVEPEHFAAGGFAAEDRRGRLVKHRLPALSLGCVMIDVELFHSHHDVAAAVAEAKHQAKMIPGSSLFVERRRVPEAIR